MQFDFNEYYKKVKDEGEVILAYQGTITSDVINSMLDSIESKLEERGIDPKVKKKVYNILVEGLQNLYHHVDEIPETVLGPEYSHKFGMVVVRRINDLIKISFGNFINAKKTSYLRDKIEKINSLSEEELKDMYKFILNHQRLSLKGGGGLGLIDIARKSGNKLEYFFYDINSEYQFYNLNVIVKTI